MEVRHKRRGSIKIRNEKNESQIIPESLEIGIRLLADGWPCDKEEKAKDTRITRNKRICMNRVGA